MILSLTVITETLKGRMNTRREICIFLSLLYDPGGTSHDSRSINGHGNARYVDPTVRRTHNPRESGGSLGWDGISSELTHRRSAGRRSWCGRRRTNHLTGHPATETRRNSYCKRVISPAAMNKSFFIIFLLFHVWAAAQSIFPPLWTSGWVSPCLLLTKPSSRGVCVCVCDEDGEDLF